MIVEYGKCDAFLWGLIECIDILNYFAECFTYICTRCGGIYRFNNNGFRRGLK